MPFVLPGLLLPSPPGTLATLPMHIVRFVETPHFHRPPLFTMTILAVDTSSVAVDRRPMVIGPESVSNVQPELITTELSCEPPPPEPEPTRKELFTVIRPPLVSTSELNP